MKRFTRWPALAMKSLFVAGVMFSLLSVGPAAQAQSFPYGGYGYGYGSNSSAVPVSSDQLSTLIGQLQYVQNRGGFRSYNPFVNGTNPAVPSNIGQVPPQDLDQMIRALKYQQQLNKAQAKDLKNRKVATNAQLRDLRMARDHYYGRPYSAYENSRYMNPGRLNNPYNNYYNTSYAYPTTYNAPYGNAYGNAYGSPYPAYGYGMQPTSYSTNPYLSGMSPTSSSIFSQILQNIGI